MLSCKEVATAISSGELERATVLRRLRVELHLWMCKYCRAYRRQMRVLGDAARRLIGREPVDPARLGRLERELVDLCDSGRRPGDDPSA